MRIASTSLAVLAATLASACGSPPEQRTQSLSGGERALNERAFVERNGALEFFGGGCLPLGPDEGAPPASSPALDAPAAGTGMGDDLVTAVVRGPGNGFQVSISSAGTILQTRLYSPDFVGSGGRDGFSVRSAAGTTYRLFYWGGPCSRSLAVPWSD